MAKTIVAMVKEEPHVQQHSAQPTRSPDDIPQQDKPSQAKPSQDKTRQDKTRQDNNKKSETVQAVRRFECNTVDLGEIHGDLPRQARDIYTRKTPRKTEGGCCRTEHRANARDGVREDSERPEEHLHSKPRQQPACGNE
jgi:hypothetical protein